MRTVDKVRIAKGRALRPIDATKMLWDHKRTLRHRAIPWNRGGFSNFIFTTYFVRGEDCGRNILDPLVWLFPLKAPFLWGIEVEVTTRCYLKCTICEHTYFPKDYINQDTSFETVKNLVDGIPNLRWINLTGEGSAVLNKEFGQMVQYIKGKNIYIDFSHDFFHLDESLARLWILEGVERVFVSLDGATKETYEKIRVGSDFDKVIRNVKKFIELKQWYRSPTPEMCFRMAIFKDNVHEVEKFIELIHSFGPRKDLGDKTEINLVGLLEFKETRGWECEVPQDVQKRVRQKCKEYGFTLNWSHPSHDADAKPPLEFCLAWTEPYIIMGGYVIPCCAVVMSNRRKFLEEQAFGNINELPLRDIWNSDRFKEFRLMVRDPRGPVPVVCSSCRMFDTTKRAEKYGVRFV